MRKTIEDALSFFRSLHKREFTREFTMCSRLFMYVCVHYMCSRMCSRCVHDRSHSFHVYIYTMVLHLYIYMYLVVYMNCICAWECLCVTVCDRICVCATAIGYSWLIGLRPILKCTLLYLANMEAVPPCTANHVNDAALAKFLSNCKKTAQQRSLANPEVMSKVWHIFHFDGCQNHSITYINHILPSQIESPR